MPVGVLAGAVLVVEQAGQGPAVLVLAEAAGQARITPSTEIRWRTVISLSVLPCTRARASANSMLWFLLWLGLADGASYRVQPGC